MSHFICFLVLGAEFACSSACILVAGTGSHPFVSLIVFYLSHYSLWPFWCAGVAPTYLPTFGVFVKHHMNGLLLVHFSFFFGAMLASGVASAKKFTMLHRRLYKRIWSDTEHPSGLKDAEEMPFLLFRDQFVRLADCRLPASQAAGSQVLQSRAEQDAHRRKAERALNTCDDYGRWHTSITSYSS